MRIIFYIKVCTALILLSFSAGSSLLAQKKVLVISVDGLSPFAIKSSHTPNMDGLVSNSTYSFEGQTLAPTTDAAGWTSLLTGVWYTKHGVDSENMDNYDPGVTPSLFSLIAGANPELSSAAFVRSDTIATYLVSDASVANVYGSDDELIYNAQSALAGANAADFTFIQLDTVNVAGLGRGYDKTVSEYVLAIQYVDLLIGDLLDAVHHRPTYDEEEWMIILTANHGGTPDGAIGGSSSEEKTIPVIMSGDDVPNGEVIAKEGQDNAIQLFQYNKNDPAGSYGGIIGMYDDDIFDLPELTIELELKQTFKRGGWQTVFDINNDGTLLALQGEILKTYGRCGTNTVSNDFRFSIGVNYHIAFTIKGSTWKVFINGEMIGSGESCGDYTDGYGIGFGGGLRTDDIPNPLGDGENFLGIFNEVRVWNVALPGNVIAEFAGQRDIEQSNHPYFESDNMVLYWKMDEVDGSKVNDWSGNDHHGMANYWKDGADPERLQYKHVPAVGFQLIDIVPTVLGFLGVEQSPDWDIDGVPFEVKKVIIGPQNDGWNVMAAEHYPNPTSDVITIMVPQAMKSGTVITVANSNGAILKNDLVGSCSTQLNVSEYAPGIYFYSLKDGESIVMGKFIVR